MQAAPSVVPARGSLDNPASRRHGGEPHDAVVARRPARPDALPAADSQPWLGPAPYRRARSRMERAAPSEPAGSTVSFRRISCRDRRRFVPAGPPPRLPDLVFARRLMKTLSGKDRHNPPVGGSQEARCAMMRMGRRRGRSRLTGAGGSDRPSRRSRAVRPPRHRAG